MTQQEAMMQQVISLIAQGVLGVFKQNFPNLVDPVAPVPVKRVRVDSSGNEQEVTEVVNFAQLLAELNDNVIELNELMQDQNDKLEELAEEEEEEEKPRRKRRK